MTIKSSRRKPKRILRLPDLDHTKTTVLSTLRSPDSQRSYRFAIDDFMAWYCSEPRLAFNKTVVLRYRLQLEARHLASSTINVRLAAVRRLAYEAADSGLLSPDLAASIRRVKSVKNFGVRLGNWLTPSQGKALLGRPNTSSVRGKRDRAILALLLGCGLRRSKLVHLTMEHLQQREEHWAIIDLIGKDSPVARRWSGQSERTRIARGSVAFTVVVSVVLLGWSGNGRCQFYRTSQTCRPACEAHLRSSRKRNGNGTPT